VLLCVGRGFLLSTAGSKPSGLAPLATRLSASLAHQVLVSGRVG